MPFDWSEKNIRQISVVHQELIIPKTFGDLMVQDFAINVNELQVSDSVVTVDDFSAENRVIHLVLSQDDILQLSKKMQNHPDKMYFSIMPSADNLPLSTMTENAQFKLNLSWEPQNIKSDSKIIFLPLIQIRYSIKVPLRVTFC